MCGTWREIHAPRRVDAQQGMYPCATAIMSVALSMCLDVINVGYLVSAHEDTHAHTHTHTHTHTIHIDICRPVCAHQGTVVACDRSRRKVDRIQALALRPFVMLLLL